MVLVLASLTTHCSVQPRAVPEADISNTVLTAGSPPRESGQKRRGACSVFNLPLWKWLGFGALSVVESALRSWVWLMFSYCFGLVIGFFGF